MWLLDGEGQTSRGIGFRVNKGNQGLPDWGNGKDECLKNLNCGDLFEVDIHPIGHSVPFQPINIGPLPFPGNG